MEICTCMLKKTIRSKGGAIIGFDKRFIALPIIMLVLGQ